MKPADNHAQPPGASRRQCNNEARVIIAVWGSSIRGSSTVLPSFQASLQWYCNRRAAAKAAKSGCAFADSLQSAWQEIEDICHLTSCSQLHDRIKCFAIRAHKRAPVDGNRHPCVDGLMYRDCILRRCMQR